MSWSDDEKRALLSMLARGVELLEQIAQNTTIDDDRFADMMRTATNVIDEERNPAAPAALLRIAKDDEDTTS